MSAALTTTPIASVESHIHVIRGQRVMLDRDLAGLYGVKAIALRQQVKRNRGRFPKDFLLQLDARETRSLVSQNVIADERSLGGSRPYAFTEQGVAMLSSVLTSKKAVQVNIAIMRAFVKLREIVATHKELAQKIAELEHKFQKHDAQIVAVFDAIRQLIEPKPVPPKRRIGFPQAQSL